MQLSRAAALALLTGAAGAPAALRAQAPPPIRLGTVRNESSGLAFYAQEQGTFKAAGLDVQIQSFNAGGQITAALAGGALDIGCTNVGSLSNAHARGLPLAIVAPGGQYSTNSPTTVLAVAKASPLQTARDLNGKTIGLSTLGDLQQAAVMKWVDTNGGDARSLKFIELVVAEMAAALQTGRVDAATLLEPSLTYAKNDVRIFAKVYDALAKSLLITAHFGTSDWLDKNAAVVKKLIAVLHATAQWANKNPGPAGEILARISQIPPATIAQMNRVVYGETLDPALIQPVVDGLAQYKLLPKGFPAAELIWPPARPT